MRRLSTPPRASTHTLSRSIQDLPSAERNEGARWALGFSFHRSADRTQPDEARPEYGSGTKALVASLAHRLPPSIEERHSPNRRTGISTARLGRVLDRDRSDS